MSTYTPISYQTLSSAAASVTFSGIPQTYTDLIIVIGNALTTVNGYAYTFGVNGDTNSNYSGTILAGNGSAVTSARYSNISHTQTYFGGYYSGFSTTDVATLIVNFQNYSNTTTNKTIIARSSAASKHVETSVWLWRSTSAINQITIYSQSGANIASGTTFTLYGIGAGSPKAFGGDTVTTDGTYWYHTYRSSGIFAPMQNLTCDYLVVAGGGGGSGGGGGAGGLRSTVTATGGGGSLESALSLVNGTNYTVTVGAGGAGGISVSTTANGTNGSNSVFSTITSTGGGGGSQQSGNVTSTPTKNGGSGGGAGYDQGAGTGTSNQGYGGGTSVTASQRGCGGGGGAGAAGANGTTAGGGNGGNGVAVSISGSSVTYAGGGGGGNFYSGSGGVTNGTGGTGGGGNAGAVTKNNGSAGTANLGGGGGGASDGPNPAASTTGGNGGSGIVIVRYAV